MIDGAPKYAAKDFTLTYFCMEMPEMLRRMQIIAHTYTHEWIGMSDGITRKTMFE